ncbi:hypothetical protein HR060_10755 [Catenovulum sp. SM1970]|uniref:hypothetical protein n=1 Tax=Marinifaba aquimaris TaxID=2741323 RepID=UPI001574A311|nr:hypothetical protein [Marinifaba aquimaris]NTS77344.1 hypothetical protein [Marinifaba aquimaris]
MTISSPQYIPANGLTTADLDQQTNSIQSQTGSTVNAARDNVKNEVKRTSAGSLYALLNSAIANGKTNKQLYDYLTNVRDTLEGTSNRDLTDVYNLVNGKLSTVVNRVATGFVSTSATGLANNSEDNKYFDVTIPAVNVGKSLAFFDGFMSNGVSRTVSEHYNTTVRLINSTTVRMSCRWSDGATIVGRWKVIEFK